MTHDWLQRIEDKGAWNVVNQRLFRAETINAIAVVVFSDEEREQDPQARVQVEAFTGALFHNMKALGKSCVKPSPSAGFVITHRPSKECVLTRNASWNITWETSIT